MVVPPNHPILIGFSIINHPFWGTPIFGNTHMNKNIEQQNPVANDSDVFRINQVGKTQAICDICLAFVAS